MQVENLLNAYSDAWYDSDFLWKTVDGIERIMQREDFTGSDLHRIVNGNFHFKSKKGIVPLPALMPFLKQNTI